jgi:Tol biopolymer transport system component
MRSGFVIVLLLLLCGLADAGVVKISTLDLPVQVVGDASLSADGSSIVFVGLDASQKPQIYTVNIDGSNLTQLTSDTIKKWGAVWGENRIYFISHNSYGIEKVFVINPDGSDMRELMAGNVRQGKSTEDEPPAWGAPSYAAGFIVFTSFDDNALDKIFIAEADGSNPRIVHPERVRQWNPSLSWDGERIAFISYDENNWQQVFVMKRDGSGKTQLTFDNVKKSDPKWRGNDTIVFVSFDTLSDPREMLYGMKADGSEKRRLLREETSRQLSSSWSRDGRYMVYVAKPIRGDVKLKVVKFEAPAVKATPLPPVVVETTATPTPEVTETPQATATPAVTTAVPPETNEKPEIGSKPLSLIVGLLFAMFLTLVAVLNKLLS